MESATPAPVPDSITESSPAENPVELKPEEEIPPPTPTYCPIKSSDFLEACLQNKTEEALLLLKDPQVDPNTATQEKVPLETLKEHKNIPKGLQNLLSADTQITALMAAASHNQADLCKKLIEAGANRWSKTKRWKTTAIWLAGKEGATEAIQEILLVKEDSPARKTLVKIDVSTQKGKLIQDQEILLEFPVSTGKKSKPTPKGTFVVTDKHRHHTSSIYGSSMPYFMRLSARDFGLHQGKLPGYPASSGCIRLNPKDAKKLFEKVLQGSTVVIE